MVNMAQKRNINREMEIILALLRQSTHVRDLSKQTGIPHATTSRMLEKLGARNIVDFEARGKNKVVNLKKNIEALNTVKMAESYKLEKLIRKYPETAAIIEEILEKMKQLKKTGKIILIFGSYAKFNARPDSDIDLFVDTEDRNIKRELERISSKMSVKTGRLSSGAGKPLAKEIIRNHVIISGIEAFYEKNQIFD